MHIIKSIDSNTKPIGLSLIQRLFNSQVIIEKNSSVLHKFNCGLISKISRPALCSIIHYCYLYVWIITSISHCYRWIYREVVAWYCLEIGFIFAVLFISQLIVKYSFYLSFHHLKTVWICPKLTHGIEPIVHFPIHCHIFPLKVIYWNRIQFNFEFDQFIEIRCKSNFYYCLFLVLIIKY